MQISNALKAAVIVGLLLPSVSQAYVDPSAGSSLFQFLFPLFVAVGAGWCVLRDKVAIRVRRLLRRSKPGAVE